MSVRIGVVADTHCPEFLDALPGSLFEQLAGVDLIIHAGDVGGPETIVALERLAPVLAVHGDHDRALPELPTTIDTEVAGCRIGVIHGNRSHLVEEPITLLGTLTLGYFWPVPGLDAWLLRRFPGADVIIHGHTHAPLIRHHGSTLIFNPGAVYQVDRAAALRRLGRGPNWFEWSWLQVARHRRRVPAPTVGLLEVGPEGVRATVLPLGAGAGLR